MCTKIKAAPNESVAEASNADENIYYLHGYIVHYHVAPILQIMHAAYLIACMIKTKNQHRQQGKAAQG
jgi:hypothetical protein